MDPLLKWPELSALICQSAKTNSLAVGENHFQAQHHIGDPAVTGHAITDAAFINHCADHHRRAVGAEVGKHEPVLPQGVMNSVDTGAAFSNDKLLTRIHFEDLVHAEHVEQDAALERRADAHADAAFGDDRDLVLVGEFQNFGDGVVPGGIRFDTNNHVGQRAVRAVGERMLIIDLVDGIG